MATVDRWESRGFREHRRGVPVPVSRADVDPVVVAGERPAAVARRGGPLVVAALAVARRGAVPLGAVPAGGAGRLADTRTRAGRAAEIPAAEIPAVVDLAVVDLAAANAVVPAGRLGPEAVLPGAARVAARARGGQLAPAVPAGEVARMGQSAV